MKLEHKIGIGVFVLAALVFAGTEVDQGKPGHYGSWPVLISGGTLSLNSAVTVDGGVLGTVNTITNPVIVKTITTGGSPGNIPFETTGSLVDFEDITVPSNGTSCTVPGGASCTTIYGTGGQTYLSYTNLTITVYNSGSNVLTDCIIEWSTSASVWEAWDSTTFAGLAAGAIKSMALTGNSRRNLRLQARSAAGTTTTVTITANGRAF